MSAAKGLLEHVALRHRRGLLDSFALWHRLMRTFNRFARRKRRAPGIAETLEERALMTSTAATVAIEQVRLLELDATSVRSAETAQSIPIAWLPAVVFAAVNARLPEATLLAAETDTASGSRQFGVRVVFQGANLDVTLSPDGRVLEIEQTVAIAEVPTALSEWLGHQFPGAQILQATRITADRSVSYELLIASSGQTPIEAKLHLTDASSSATLPLPRDASGRALATVAAANSTKIECVSEPLAGRNGHGEVDDDRDAVAIIAPVSTANRTDDARDSDSDRIQTSLSAKRSPEFARADESAWTESVSGLRRPLAERSLSELLPVDFAAIEQALRQFLDGVDSLTDPQSDAGPVRRELALLATLAALLGVERAISDRRKRDQGVVLATVGRSSWSWVLKLSSVSRSWES